MSKNAMPVDNGKKGMDLSRDFWREVVAPVLEDRFPGFFSVVSAGLIGSNSQIYGYDDTISRDHAWGPYVIIYIPNDIDDDMVAAVDSALKATLPSEFQGFALSAHRDCPYNMPDYVLVRANEAKRFLVGFGNTPVPQWGWLTIPECRLYDATAGEIFHDPQGVMGNWRKAIRYYPDDVWLKRISFSWYCLASSGQMARHVKRQSTIPARIEVAWFLEMAMRLALLLERRYAPWHKWLLHECRLRCGADFPIASLCEELAEAKQLAEQERLMFDILDMLGRRAMDSSNVVVEDLRTPPGACLMNFNYGGFANAFRDKISGELKSLPLDVGPVDMWGGLRTLTSQTPCFIGNEAFAKSVYGPWISIDQGD